MIKAIKDAKVITIIGLAKNVGKTTTLNYLIDNLKAEVLGLTSIGYDGEKIDHVTLTKKPEIYVNKGTLIATARGCLSQSDITKKIVATTNIFTPLGEVIIFKSLSQGKVILAGPNSNAQLKVVKDLLLKLGATKVLIDGAISRKSQADGLISDATILCTGASVNRSIKQVVDETLFTYQMLTLPVIGNELKFKFNLAPLSVIDDEGNQIVIPSKTALNSEMLMDYLTPKTKFLIIQGALTNTVLNKVLRMPQPLNLIVESGLKCFINKNMYQQFCDRGGKIFCLRNINVVLITVNPFSPEDNSFMLEISEKLKEELDIPIFNVRGKANG